MKTSVILRAIWLMVVVLALLAVSGAAVQAQTPADGTPTSEEPTTAPTQLLEGIIEARTPEPTATPDILAEGVSRLAERTGLSGQTFLGLSVEDWINLGISMLIILIGYLIGTWLIRRILPTVVQRTVSQLDDRLLATSGSQIRWLVVLLVLQFATIRLGFLSVEAKEILTDIYFVLGVIIVLLLTLELINLTDAWYRERAADLGREEQLNPLITLLVRMGRVVAALVAVIILLSNFGVNVTAFAAALGLGGLAFSLAAKDTVADAIAGFIILVDRPFRIGDRIEIQGAGTWGDVTDIGLRTTRIRTRDNRLVIVPNSVIGSNQVINYSYPDSRYRIETHVGVAYGTDIETARRVMIEAVQGIEGVLPDKPVDALYIEMGDSAMIFRVRWWIESYVDTRRMFDKVHTSLQHALDQAGIESPYPTQNLNLHVEDDGSRRVSGALDRAE